ncbi:hypothetical protein BVX97_00470 [bacterium E08(2017)]|nr:hypothetical protein BVX97_00470 [bacterium E08(2017)]
MSKEKLKFQDDPEVLAFQFFSLYERGDEQAITFGSNAYVKDGLTWDQIFKGVSDGSIVQFVNGKAQVWKKRMPATSGTISGFQQA